MKTTLTRLGVAALGSLLVATGLIVSAPSAEAASPCPGSRVARYQLYAGGEVADNFRHGQIEVWYSSAKGGTNCVLVYDNVSGKHKMTVEAGISGRASAGKDSGTYNYYAGPIKITNTDGKCISLYAEVINGGISYRRAMNKIHCG